MTVDLAGSPRNGPRNGPGEPDRRMNMGLGL
jgi:hypothetical protein